MAKVVLSDGREFEVTGVSDALVDLVKAGARKEFIARGEPIDPPTYIVIGAGETAHEEPHDETTLETPEDISAWEKHKDALRRLSIETNNRAMKAWLTGLKVDFPEDESWKEKQKWLGVVLPENPIDLMYHYILTEVLKSPDDLMNVIDKIMKESYRGVIKEDDLDAAMNSFRGALQGKASSRFANAKKPLDAQYEVVGVEDGEGVGVAP